MSGSRRAITACWAAGGLLALALPAAAVDPWVDTGFTPTTSRPDPDLVVVRERFYATPIDLGALGISGGPHDYVQSIYFRLFVDHDPEADSFTGVVLFPEEITILGFVVDSTLLGGAGDDGLWTQSDSIFGIGDDPDRYSESDRGFEIGGGVATSEFVIPIDHRAFAFGLNVTGGVDDMRVIIDYGSAFGEGLAFDVLAYDVGWLGGAVPSEGIRVGDDSNPVVFGSGDYGETPSLLGIPLTSASAPVPGPGLTYDPEASVFILRDTPDTTWVDGYDTLHNVPLPDLFEIVNHVGSPVGITDGSDGLLYSIGRAGGFAAMNANRPDLAPAEWVLTDLAGDNIDLTNVPGTDTLFVVRDTSGDTQVDWLDPSVPALGVGFAMTDPLTPVGITDGPDGKLYVLGQGGYLGWAERDGTGIGVVFLDPPNGGYVDLSSRDGSSELYLLRDTDGDSQVDVFDTVTQSVSHGFSSFAEPSAPVGITDGPGGVLHVIGEGTGSNPTGYVAIDASSGAVLVAHQATNFAGENVRITNVAVPTLVGAPERRPRSAGMRHHAVPNPFRGCVTIRYELARSASVRVTLYDVLGRQLRVLRSGGGETGWQAVTWDGRDESGRLLPSGTYFYTVRTGSRSLTGKVQLLR